MPALRFLGFDFAEAMRVFESSPEDPTKMRVNTRLVKFINVPELVRHFRSFVDVQTAKENGIVVPKSNAIHPRHRHQSRPEAITSDELGQRAETFVPERLNRRTTTCH